MSKFLISRTKTVAEVTKTLDSDLEIEILPNSNGENISEIIGKIGDKECKVGQEELYGIPLVIDGTGASLSERVKCHLKGNLNPKGEFNLFLTGMCTTLVQFKISGKLFGDDLLKEVPGAKISPQIFSKAIFKKIAKHQTTNPELKVYISKMVNFWNNYHHFFHNRDIELEILRNEIIDLRRELDAIKKMITPKKDESRNFRKY